MMKFKYTYPLFAAIIMFLCACTKEHENVMQQTKGPDFVIGTKASSGIESPTTFHIMAYGAQRDNHFKCISSGAYTIENVDFNGFAYLTSTKPLVIPIDEIGNEFYVSYVSPAKDHSDGSFMADDFDTPLYCSDIQRIQLFNYGLVEIKNELVDRRSKIGFRFYKDDPAKEIIVEDVQISGAGNMYWPATKQVTNNNHKDTLDIEITTAQDETGKLLYDCTDFEKMPFVLSGIYAPKDSVASYLKENYLLEYTPTNLSDGNYLSAIFRFSVNGGGMQKICIPLTRSAFEVFPLTTHIYNITISETFIYVTLYVTPQNSWEEGGYDTSIKDNTTRIDLGKFKITSDGWDENDNWDDNAEIK